jgi:protein arginine N-methyltransferase 1
VSLILDEHRQYLADPSRLDAFRRAMAAVVAPGDVVLDLGSGTGILGFLACQAGAAHVYAVDDGGIIAIARDLAAANGLADRITFIRDHSTQVILPERVDVAVCDQLGPLGIEAGAIEYLRDARRRHLKPDGRIIPGAVTIQVAALESDELRHRLDFWSQRPAGLDLSAARSVATNTGYPFAVEAPQLLSAGASVAQVAIDGSGEGMFAGQVSLEVQRAGRLDGICAWFLAHLSPGVTMTNDPTAPDRISRRQVMLPIESPVAVGPGDIVEARLLARSAELVVMWDVVVTRDGRRLAQSRHSTFHGMLVTNEEVRRTDPDLRPQLSPAGQARRTVVTMCDGTATVAEIEAATYRRHRSLFASPADAAAFVAEVLTRYAR